MTDRTATPGPGSTAALGAAPVTAEIRPSTSAGLWVREAGTSVLDPSAVDQTGVRTVPGDTRYTLLVGAPGEPLPEIGLIAEAVRSLPPFARDRLVMTVYGSEPEGGLSLAQRVADVLDESVRVHHGILTTDPDGTSHRTAVDDNGRPSWRPFTQLSTYRPGQLGVTVDRWNAPFSGAQLIGPGRYRLTADWVVDVVPAGLIARPATAAPDPLLRCAPTHPERVDLVLDCPNQELLPDDMLTALGRLGDSLAPSARSRLRLLLTPGVRPASERALRWAVPAPQIPWVAPRTGYLAAEVVEPAEPVEVIERVELIEPVEVVEHVEVVERLEVDEHREVDERLAVFESVELADTFGPVPVFGGSDAAEATEAAAVGDLVEIVDVIEPVPVQPIVEIVDAEPVDPDPPVEVVEVDLGAPVPVIDVVETGPTPVVVHPRLPAARLATTLVVSPSGRVRLH